MNTERSMHRFRELASNVDDLSGFVTEVMRHFDELKESGIRDRARPRKLAETKGLRQMTKKKTSLEKLESHNATVTDERSALNVSSWKWREAREMSRNLWTLINHKCGFCVLARRGSTGRCSNCPIKVEKYCQAMLNRSTELSEALDELIDDTLTFLAEYKLEEKKDD
jgi:hypothetical protein